MFGFLPLNPTKQNIAWGEEENGSVHKKNLYTWVGAYAYLYWSVHYQNFFGKSKKALSDGVTKHLPAPTATGIVKTIDYSHFTQFSDIFWKYIRHTGNIRCGNLKRIKISIGNDTRRRFKKRKLSNRGEAAALTATAGSTMSLSAVTIQSPNCRIPTNPGAPEEMRSPLQVKAGDPDEEDYKTMYENEKRLHEKLQRRYEEKRDYKKLSKDLYAENQRLEREIEDLRTANILEIAKLTTEIEKERDNIASEQDRLKRMNGLLEERDLLTQEDGDVCTRGSKNKLGGRQVMI